MPELGVTYISVQTGRCFDTVPPQFQPAGMARCDNPSRIIPDIPVNCVIAFELPKMLVDLLPLFFPSVELLVFTQFRSVVCTYSSFVHSSEMKHVTYNYRIFDMSNGPSGLLIQKQCYFGICTIF